VDDQEPLSDTELRELERLVAHASPAPWVASIEGRDHTSGDDVILVGGPLQEDMYVSRGTGPVSESDLDFIAAARTLVPRLIAEVKRARGTTD
jgi:hypothetical protein